MSPPFLSHPAPGNQSARITPPTLLPPHSPHPHRLPPDLYKCGGRRFVCPPPRPLPRPSPAGRSPSPPIFPIIGKTAGTFSNHWKHREFPEKAWSPVGKVLRFPDSPIPRFAGKIHPETLSPAMFSPFSKKVAPSSGGPGSVRAEPERFDKDATGTRPAPVPPSMPHDCLRLPSIAIVLFPLKAAAKALRPKAKQNPPAAPPESRPARAPPPRQTAPP